MARLPPAQNAQFGALKHGLPANGDPVQIGPCALAPSGASYRVSPVSWPDFAAADQADLVRIIKRKLKKIQYRPT